MFNIHIAYSRSEEATSPARNASKSQVRYVMDGSFAIDIDKALQGFKHLKYLSFWEETYGYGNNPRKEEISRFFWTHTVKDFFCAVFQNDIHLRILEFTSQKQAPFSFPLALLQPLSESFHVFDRLAVIMLDAAFMDEEVREDESLATLDVLLNHAPRLSEFSFHGRGLVSSSAVVA